MFEGITYTKNTGKRQLVKSWSVSGSAGMELMPMLYLSCVKELLLATFLAESHASVRFSSEGEE